MIVGHGDIAGVIPDREDILFFASGVSNSGCTDEGEYVREMKLLLEQPRDSHLVYFSSLSIFYADTRYTIHKHIMEDMIKRLFERYCILRLGNITWGTNPHTLINYLREKIRRGEPCEIRDEYRYIVEPMELLHWINLMPDWSCEMNVVGKRMKVMEVVREYCMPKGTKWYGKSINYNSVPLLQVRG